MAYGSVDETDSRRGNDSSGDFAVCKDQVHGLSFDAEPPVHRVSIAYPPIGRTNVDSIVCGADAFDPCVYLLVIWFLRNPLLRCDAYRHNTCCNETHVKAIALYVCGLPVLWPNWQCLSS